MTREQFDDMNFLAGRQDVPPLQVLDFIDEVMQRAQSPEDMFRACARVYALGQVAGVRQERSRKRTSASRASVKGGAES